MIHLQRHVDSCQTLPVLDARHDRCADSPPDNERSSLAGIRIMYVCSAYPGLQKERLRLAFDMMPLRSVKNAPVVAVVSNPYIHAHGGQRTAHLGHNENPPPRKAKTAAGFGDITPGHSVAVANFLLILIGLSVVSMSINVLQMQLEILFARVVKSIDNDFKMNLSVS
ncbi:hypothetical protein ANCCEY_15631, partial [Ancylostoma ceylanicum]